MSKPVKIDSIEKEPAVDVLSRLSLEEQNASQNLKKSEQEAILIIERSREKAQEILAQVRIDAELLREKVLASRQKQIDADCEKILSDAKSKVDSLKPKKGVARKLLQIVLE